MASSSSPNARKSNSWVYDVFLSFRGEDTRNNFTDHLYTALSSAGIRTFRDSEGLGKGEDIAASLMRAIQESRFYLIVFSDKYADSKWCLNELMLIMDCSDRTAIESGLQDGLQELIIPIFYLVDPSDVRRQTGSFGAAFQKHGVTYLASCWRATLQRAANLSGWDVKTDQSEADIIRNIVDDISGRLNNTYLHVAVYPVGIDSRVQDIIGNSLGVGLDDDVRMVGIWGMSGSGKTSLAKAIYNKLFHSFEGKSFLANVRETAYKSNGMINLQEKLLSDILKPTKVEVREADRGVIVIHERLKSKKVLVIVDDVDEIDQLYALAIRHNSFGPGSRIIITTRDRHLLEIIKVDAIHLTGQMKEHEALELFSWSAFHNAHPDSKFLKVSTKICTYCRGLPLAIEVLGSLLFQSTVSQFEDMLHKLKECPNDKIQKILRISFDALDRNQKAIFLHISCFFIGMDKNYVKKILEGCGLFAETDISVLFKRCLVIVNEKNKLMMHDLLRDMGREVVRAESYEDPEERSRLWCRKEVINVLTEESGTKKIEGLALNLQRSNKKSFRTKTFTNMQRLKLLQLNYVKLTGDYHHLSKKLSWLCWHGLSLKFIGNEFLYQGNLVSMDLRYSNLVRVWEHPRVLEKLKILNLSHSHYLTQSPDVAKLPNLEYFIMKDCRSLSEIHPSIGDVKRLALVNFKDCQKLKDLPRSFYKLKFMETLVLSGCSRFETLVGDIGDMTSLTTLAVTGTAISRVPSYIGRLKNLNFSSVQGLVRLKQRFPEVPKNYFPSQDYTSLRYVNMDNSIVHELPELSGLSLLERPCFNNCTNLPASGDLATRSKELELDHCTALEIYPNSSKVSSKSIMQGWTASGDGGICLPANDFPGRFAYVRESDQVFFQVPQYIGPNLKAFTICVLCSSFLDEDISPSGISIFVTNYTKLIMLAVRPTHRNEITSHEVIWRSEENGSQSGPSHVSSVEDRPSKRLTSVMQEQPMSPQNNSSTETHGHKQNPKSSQRFCLPKMNCKWRWCRLSACWASG
ncbi:hypothetical protein M0R45_001777 [Rubus argutus]|uniref:TIR domain-containing protein n=1 Tax=Rubus argutus TaxID=59490 RepID=A0AAW1VFS7_RUBAR